MIVVDDRSAQAVVALGATVAALGGGALVVLLTVSEEFPWWTWTVVWAALVIGLLILLMQAVPSLGRLASEPFRRYKMSRAQERVREARYRQRLRCNAQGHIFEEVVRNTPEGWLEYDGATRSCPICGNSTEGFQSLGAQPLNKAAEKGRFI